MYNVMFCFHTLFTASPQGATQLQSTRTHNNPNALVDVDVPIGSCIMGYLPIQTTTLYVRLDSLKEISPPSRLPAQPSPTCPLVCMLPFIFPLFCIFLFAARLSPCTLVRVCCFDLNITVGVGIWRLSACVFLFHSLCFYYIVCPTLPHHSGGLLSL